MKPEFNDGSGITSPSLRSSAVSRQRHHWLEYIVLILIPFSKNFSPMFAACFLPISLRLRWVEQSSISNFSGSPLASNPGAKAWRRKITLPNGFSAYYASVNSKEFPDASIKHKNKMQKQNILLINMLNLTADIVCNLNFRLDVSSWTTDFINNSKLYLIW